MNINRFTGYSHPYFGTKNKPALPDPNNKGGQKVNIDEYIALIKKTPKDLGNETTDIINNAERELEQGGPQEN